MQHQHRVTATLTRDPVACMAMGGAWLLLLELRQHSEPDPITGAWQFGHGESAAQAAHSAAYRLRRGQAVQVWYAGLGLGHTQYERRASIELRGISSVQEVADPAPMHAAPSASAIAAAEEAAAHGRPPVHP